MKVWLSAELSKDVLTEEQILQECKARNAAVDTLNLRLNDKFYNIPLNSWDCIIIIMGEDSFEESIYYSIKRQNMDFRLRIDPATFKATDHLGRKKLIFSMLLKSLNLLKIKFEKVRLKLNSKVFEELGRVIN
ncbi:Imm44 family immunity protein [Acinetobacter sp. F16]|uniref:Imm44 family immunity protein n=1 Tax=Acinetobacter sp. F16 TaxID=3462438 RepID=UPI004046DAE3